MKGRYVVLGILLIAGALWLFKSWKPKLKTLKSDKEVKETETIEEEKETKDKEEKEKNQKNLEFESKTVSVSCPRCTFPIVIIWPTPLGSSFPLSSSSSFPSSSSSFSSLPPTHFLGLPVSTPPQTFTNTTTPMPSVPNMPITQVTEAPIRSAPVSSTATPSPPTETPSPSTVSPAPTTATPSPQPINIGAPLTGYPPFGSSAAPSFYQNGMYGHPGYAHYPMYHHPMQPLSSGLPPTITSSIPALSAIANEKNASCIRSGCGGDSKETKKKENDEKGEQSVPLTKEQGKKEVIKLLTKHFPSEDSLDLSTENLKQCGVTFIKEKKKWNMQEDDFQDTVKEYVKDWSWSTKARLQWQLPEIKKIFQSLQV